MAIISLASADKLANHYLPPNHASTSGGHPGFLQSPSYQQQQQVQYRPQQSGGHYHGAATAGSNYIAGASSAGIHRQPAYHANPVPILRSTANNDGQGNYNFGFETGNGIRRDESGVYHPGHPEGSQTVSGSYSFVGDDGKTYTVKYHADETGFHAEGDHLPTPPPIPQEIAQSLSVHRQSSHSDQSGAYHHSSQGAYNSNNGAYSSASYGGHAAANQPAPKYLPPQAQQQQGYNYGPRHY